MIFGSLVLQISRKNSAGSPSCNGQISGQMVLLMVVAGLMCKKNRSNIMLQ
jgi:hypothetical protein